MTNEKELSRLIKQVQSLGATVNVKFDDQGFHSEIQIIGLKGVGSHPVTGMIHAAEMMRAVVAASKPHPAIGDTITIKINGWTTEMKAIGRGEFPYDCKSKDKYPNAMIYQDQSGGWVGDYGIEDTGLGYFRLKDTN